MEYQGGKKNEAPMVFVGKGVTFDTGGINLKPSDAILGMNMDMSGGAAVIHMLSLAARLGVKKNLVALVPAVENMPSGSSYRPGDVLRSMSGKTIEVLNTDAEGRIILADALHYAKRYAPRLVIDVATLTGASLVALGERALAIFTRDQALETKLRELGEMSGDYVWPLPLWEEYDEEVKGTFGDVANIGRTKWAAPSRRRRFSHNSRPIICGRISIWRRG
jgi:leucyl aminopeptidase